jgi:hypothetical protein
VTSKTIRWSPWAISLCLTVFFLWISSYWMGLSLYDDSGYLQGGAGFRWSDFIHQQAWGPLYWLWFKVLAYVCPNPVARYFLAWGLVAFLIGMIPAWMKTPSAWAYSFVIVVFPFLTIGPYVSLFAAMIAVFSMCVVLRRERSMADALALSCVVSFVLAFARPEYNYGVFLSAAATLGVLAVDLIWPRADGTRAPSRSWIRAVAMAAVVTVLSGILYHLRNYSHARSGMAFAQHYNIQAASRGLLPAPIAWKLDYAQRVFNVDTAHTAADTTATISQYFHANPRLFLLFVGRNFINFRCLIPLAVLLAAVLWPWLRENARKFRPASLFLLILAVPPMAGVIFIYPDAHYWVIFIPALTVFALHMMKRPQWFDAPSVPWVLGTGCALIWLFNVGFALREDIPLWDVHENQRNLSRVECVRELDLMAEPARPDVFDSAGMVPVYFTNGRRITGPDTLADWPKFRAWVDATRPSWITADAVLGMEYHVSAAELGGFLQGEMGYTAHPCDFDAKMTVYTRDPK